MPVELICLTQRLGRRHGVGWGGNVHPPLPEGILRIDAGPVFLSGRKCRGRSQVWTMEPTGAPPPDQRRIQRLSLGGGADAGGLGTEIPQRDPDAEPLVEVRGANPPKNWGLVAKLDIF